MGRKISFPPLNQKGFSLLELAIAIGLLGLICAGVSRVSHAVTRNSTSLEQRLDRLAVKSVLLTSLDCAQTLPENLADCSSLPYLELQNSMGKAIFADGGEEGILLGKYRMRAYCEPGNLVVETRLAQKKDSKWEPLFPPGLELCRGSFIPLTGSPTIIEKETIVNVPCDPKVSSCSTTTTVCPLNPVRVGVNVCESVGEYRFDACISKGKKAAKCERKERRVYRKCNKWAGMAQTSPVIK